MSLFAAARPAGGRWLIPAVAAGAVMTASFAIAFPHDMASPGRLGAALLLLWALASHGGSPVRVDQDTCGSVNSDPVLRRRNPHLWPARGDVGDSGHIRFRSRNAPTSVSRPAPIRARRPPGPTPRNLGTITGRACPW